MTAVRVENLTKRFGDREVLKGVYLNIAEGEFYALMGPNGSGKTTLAAIIASIRRPSSGKVTIYGQPPRTAKNMIGYIPQEHFSSPKLTARENLAYFARLLNYSPRRAAELTDDLLVKIGLAGDADKRVEKFSGGMRKRLEVATALFPGIRLLILDEPTTGLDPGARRSFFNLISRLREDSATILLITHIGSDAELASRVGLIDDGHIIAEGEPEALKRRHGLEDTITIEMAAKNEDASRIVRSFSNSRGLVETESGYRIYSPDSGRVLAELARSLEQAGHRILRLEMAKPTLEDVFFKLTDKSIRETD